MGHRAKQGTKLILQISFINKCIQVRVVMNYTKTTLLNTILYLNFLPVTQKFWSLSFEIVWNLHAVHSVCCSVSGGCLLPPFFLAVLLVTPSSFFVHSILYDVAFYFCYTAAATKEYRPNCMTLKRWREEKKWLWHLKIHGGLVMIYCLNDNFYVGSYLHIP